MNCANSTLRAESDGKHLKVDFDEATACAGHASLLSNDLLAFGRLAQGLQYRVVHLGAAATCIRPSSIWIFAKTMAW